MGYGCVCVSEIGVLLKLRICLSTDGCLGTLFSDKSILAKLGGQLSTNTNIPSKVHFDKGCFVEEHVGDSSWMPDSAWEKHLGFGGFGRCNPIPPILDNNHMGPQEEYIDPTPNHKIWVECGRVIFNTIGGCDSPKISDCQWAVELSGHATNRDWERPTMISTSSLGGWRYSYTRSGTTSYFDVEMCFNSNSSP